MAKQVTPISIKNRTFNINTLSKKEYKMNCTHCKEEIKYNGIIESGLPYHQGCFKDIKTTKKEKELAHIAKIGHT